MDEKNIQKTTTVGEGEVGTGEEDFWNGGNLAFRRNMKAGNVRPRVGVLEMENESFGNLANQDLATCHM